LLEKNNNLPEQALLVHIKLLGQVYDSLVSELEFKELTASSGITVSQLISCSLNTKAIDGRYFLGRGRLDKIAAIIAEQQINLVIFNYNLTAAQQKNLEKLLKCKVLDRTELILHIFAKRARTFEGKLQVELARLQHLSTRLVRVWTHLERQRGGVGLRAGPGEQQIEIDRRIIRNKIKNITKQLDKIKQQRHLHRLSRKKSQLSTISLVGYTNSGKSTLFNLLTNSQVEAVDMPFATLDPTVRGLFIPRVGKVLLSDTVGFIRDLPHNLVEAFKATLEEIKSSDLLIHVIDISDGDSIAKKADVMQVLEQIGATNIPILEVYNKVDQQPAMLPDNIVDSITGNVVNSSKEDQQQATWSGSVTSDKIEKELKSGDSCSIPDCLSINSNLDNYASNNLANGLAKNQGVSISALYNLCIQDLIMAISDKLCLDLVDVRLKLFPKDAKIRVELFNLGAIKQESIDPVSGDFSLDIAIQKQRWDLLCNKFINLPKMVIE
jgi:GTP-binding protein HflX